tara:strand:+ start:493 stop:639 length:147 start_codon:yes stop_codon:yes gene_type:complete
VDGIFNIMGLKEKAGVYKPKDANVVKLKEYLKKKENEASVNGNDTARR